MGWADGGNAVGVNGISTDTVVAVGSGTSVQFRQMMSGCSAMVVVIRALVVASRLAVGAMLSTVTGAMSKPSSVGPVSAETSKALLAVNTATPTNAASQTGICEKRIEHLTIFEALVVSLNAPARGAHRAPELRSNQYRHISTTGAIAPVDETVRASHGRRCASSFECLYR
ncbi:MAG TPA: hypothetical protein PKC19_07595 [Roseiflexaceae bacterium]|nr:hypothetical protein [Roseiflexaceae bacterium]